MNYTIMIDWKFVVALGTTATGFIIATKMDPAALEKVVANAADAFKEYAVALRCNR